MSQPHDIRYAGAAADDIRALRPYDRRIIMERVERHLSYEPKRASRSRIKAMRQPFRSQFRLRLEEFRVYYDVDDNLHQVQVLRVLAKSNETTPEESP